MLNLHQFRFYNRIAAWLVFFIAAAVYIYCVEPTASFWDCGEYIASVYGLETGHPPGAPLFLLFGRVFSLLSFGDVHQVAWWINVMSALASAFTVFFLHLSIVHLAKKITLKGEGVYSWVRVVAVLGAGAFGALAYAFTDSFWFSAVEGEVYALSSLFTAVVFWAILRWEDEADEPRAMRWIVFIFFLIGLSIGVHLLNLLVIPAVVFVFYYRKFPNTRIGFIGAGIVSLILLGFVQNGIVPGLVSAAGNYELWFVNKLGTSFHTGTIVYFLLLVSLLIAGLFYSQTGNKKVFYVFLFLNVLFFMLAFIAAATYGKALPVLLAIILCGVIIALTYNRRAILNVVLLSITTLIIGYSSFFVLVIRANAGTPINENNPSDAISMLRYLNREQYGDWPLLYGPYYNTPLDMEEPYTDGDPVYVRSEKEGHYIISDARKKSVSNYDDRFCTFFPRMWNSGSAQGYQVHGNVKGEAVYTGDLTHLGDTIMLPTFTENLKYFTSHQCGMLYFRYFLWNFLGRQNDRLGYGNDADGNFLTGIPLLDDRLGDQHLLPDRERANKSRNRYFLLPLLFGLFGLYWHFKRAQNDAFVVLLLFVFTGLAIVLYLNQTPYQPRERDYAYVGSFYAFAIWIGIGILALAHYVIEDAEQKKFSKTKLVSAISFVLILGMFVPLVLGVQNFDDHNRRNRTAARDVAVNMLESCEKNAVLFTYADNDTFPLWFAQEVLGVRRDVRIVCLSLLRSDWYIDQLKRKYHDSDPLPLTLDSWDYREGTRDYLNIFSQNNDTADLKKTVQFFVSKRLEDRFISTYNDTLNFIPSRFMQLPVSLKNFGYEQHTDNQREPQDTIIWALRGSYILKDQMIILDFLAHNDWKRPVYFALNMPGSAYIGLDEFLQLEGLAYRLVPFKNERQQANLYERPQVNVKKTSDFILNKFAWGGVTNLNVNVDETVLRMFTSPMRAACARAAEAACDARRTDDAIAIIRKCNAEFPLAQVPVDDDQLSLIETAYRSGATELADQLSRASFESCMQYYKWYNSMTLVPGEISSMKNYLYRLHELATVHKRISLATEYQQKLQTQRLPWYEIPKPVEDSVLDSVR